MQSDVICAVEAKSLRRHGAASISNDEAIKIPHRFVSGFGDLNCIEFTRAVELGASRLSVLTRSRSEWIDFVASGL